MCLAEPKKLGAFGQNALPAIRYVYLFRAGETGKEYYTREDLEISIHCLEFHYAQPVMRCPDGSVQWELNLQECKMKGFVDFVLTCPPVWQKDIGNGGSPENQRGCESARIG